MREAHSGSSASCRVQKALLGVLPDRRIGSGTRDDLLARASRRSSRAASGLGHIPTTPERSRDLPAMPRLPLRPHGRSGLARRLSELPQPARKDRPARADPARRLPPRPPAPLTNPPISVRHAGGRLIAPRLADGIPGRRVWGGMGSPGPPVAAGEETQGGRGKPSNAPWAHPRRGALSSVARVPAA